MAEPTDPPAGVGSPADPRLQVEDGYTRLANILLDAIALAPFPAAHLKVVLYVVRMSYGWQRTEAPASKHALAAATGLNARTIARTVADLVRAGVLRQADAGGPTRPATYRLQKDPRRWGRYRCLPPALAAWLEKRATTPTPAGGSGVQTTTPTPEGSGVQTTTPSGVQTTTPSGVQTTTPGPETPVPQAPREGERKERKERQTTLITASEAALRLFLGDKAPALDRFLASQLDRSAVPGLLGLYGPSPTDPRAARLSEPRRREALAQALDRYAAEGARYNGAFFARIMAAIATSEEASHAGTTRANGRRAPRSLAPASRRPTRYSTPQPGNDHA